MHDHLSEPAGGPEIAVIGVAGRFPGADEIGEFWRNLKSGQDSIASFGTEEVETSAAGASLTHDSRYVAARPVLKEVEGFDAGCFSMTPEEAVSIDPQHRLFLECAWTALESSGYDPSNFDGLIGTFGACGLSPYLLADGNRPVAGYGEALALLL